ncbi:RNA ligase RtcB family protein [Telmatocola sphagniphila]|uniref:3'-phosphate/5'-hydroxy nucleic acid ligase n=1 Tax=Telmatocola sphagniphila TaxID=1123043 RepID=A0A8E6B6H5_9BACT|nr:RNA ligase RtcB family protein [Telmatocola sphagniphila]QVL32787.1 RNA ligase RtcB family protein [Telmatocola sphagniphila]
MSTESNTKAVRVIASASNWVETSAIDQLKKTATLPGITQAIGFPDLHPGPGCPVGAAFVSDAMLYPHLAGNDIGCGMALYRSGLPARRPNLDRWVKKLKGLEVPWEGDAVERLESAGLSPAATSALGTIGGGNHFAELQCIDTIIDPVGAAAAGLTEDELVLLVHSGSRGLGEAILRDHVAAHKGTGLSADSTAAADYVRRHDHAVAWARENRRLIAERFVSMTGGEVTTLLDNCHNSITLAPWAGPTNWVHRKGAAAGDMGPLVIPGSRGAMSYLVAPQGDLASAAYSLAHGAGRKWARSDAKDRLRVRFSPEALSRTDLGGRVICHDNDLIYEEAPQAYKDIGRVVQDLVEAGLVSVLATLRPLITYKTRGRE